MVDFQDNPSPADLPSAGRRSRRSSRSTRSGAATKLVEAAGLAFALRLLHTPAGGARRYPRYEKELVYEQ
jgi:hypothetical protein